MGDRPLRIVIVNPAWDRRDASPDAVLDRLTTLTGWAAALRDAGAEVTVVQRFTRSARVERGLVAYRFSSGSLAREAARLHPDVVHANGFESPRLLRAVRRAVRAGVVLAVQDHGGFDPAAAAPARRAWLRFGLSVADVLLVATPPQADVFRASGLVPKSVAIRDVMESSTALQPPAGVERAGPLSILSVGRLTADKDPLTVLDGFALFAVRHPGSTLTFVYGSVELERLLRTRIDEHGLAERVQLAGIVAHDSLASRYAASHLFVSGSRREGSGYALLEAMACGAVPVVTDIPPFRSMTGGGALGALWEPGSARSLADALERMAAAPLPALSRACREAFDRQWTWAAIGQRALAIYREFSRT